MSSVVEDPRPPLLQDRSFWGLNWTQFLGAFNDNLFKQLVMLLCLDQARSGGSDLQGQAQFLFAFPFILISGFAGFLSDRFSKRTIIVICKVAELVIVLLGMTGFMLGSLPFLLGVLCLMGVHSAFFGPSKYGILPEMLREQDLPRANGMILMATFLAIIFGLSAAGAAKQQFSETLWLASLPCLIIAGTGLISSLAIRKTPVAQRDLKFEWSSLAIAPETWAVLRQNPKLLGVVLMSSVFWFVGGTTYPSAINAFSKQQFHYNDLITGLFAASTGVGIAIGCITAGILSRNHVRGWIVRLGAWGITLSLLSLALPGPGWEEVRKEIQDLKAAKRSAVSDGQKDDSKVLAPADVKSTTRPVDTGSSNAKVADGKSEQVAVSPEAYYRGTFLGPYGSAVALIGLGLFAGFFSVPLQVYLQVSAPVEQKGRMIGVFNLLNWIGIAGAGLVYMVGRALLVDGLSLPHATLFGFAACLMLPVAIFYRPPDRSVRAVEATTPIENMPTD